jgi:hypothetical protein
VNIEVPARVDQHGEPELLVGLVTVLRREVVKAPEGLLRVVVQGPCPAPGRRGAVASPSGRRARAGWPLASRLRERETGRQ